MHKNSQTSPFYSSNANIFLLFNLYSSLHSIPRRRLSAVSMPSPSSLSHSLPRSPRLPFLPLPSLKPPHPSSSSPTDSKPPPPPPNPPPPHYPSHVAAFLSALLNLPNRRPSTTPPHTLTHSPLHSPSSSLYPSLMKSITLSGRPDLSLLLFLSLPSPPSPQLLTSFLHALYHLRQPHLIYSSVSSLFPFFNLPLSPATSTVLMTSLSNLSNSPESAYAAFLSIRNPDAVAYGALIAVMCKAECVDEALGVFDVMLERGVRPTERTCTCILKAYCTEGRVAEARRFLRALESGTGSGALPRPDVIMYTAYVEGLCLVRDFESAEKVLKQAEEEASTWKPNSVTYNVYISGLCRAGMLSEAFHQVGVMRRKGLQPTIETLNVLFDCLCRDPSTVYKAKELLERSGELEWEVDSAFYNTLMSRLLEMDEPIVVLKPLTDMVKKGIKPDVCSFTIFARGLCKAGKLELAKLVITNTKFEVDVAAYNTLLRELYKLGDLQQQKLLYMHMLDRNVYPSKFTFRVMIDCLCKEGNFLEAMNYVIGLFEDNRLIGADLVPWLNKRLVAYGRLGDVLAMLDELSKRGFVLKAPLFNSLIEALCRRGYCKGEEFYRISLILDFMLGIT